MCVVSLMHTKAYAQCHAMNIVRWSPTPAADKHTLLTSDNASPWSQCGRLKAEIKHHDIMWTMPLSVSVTLNRPAGKVLLLRNEHLCYWEAISSSAGRSRWLILIYASPAPSPSTAQVRGCLVHGGSVGRRRHLTLVWSAAEIKYMPCMSARMLNMVNR